MLLHGVLIPENQIAEFCRQHHVARLSLFGSILRDDFGPESDIDMLVEFLPGLTPSLLYFAGMQSELSALLGREVQLSTPPMLSRFFRSTVLREARLVHAA